jgi:molybdopterin molybdotransferase
MAEAVARIVATAALTPAQSVTLRDAHGRFAAEDVLAAVAVPPWDNSAMDGYAVRAAEARAGASLPLAGVVAAGGVGEPLAPGTAVAIMTGAPVPDGADAVVMRENTDGSDAGRVTFTQDAQLGRNIRRTGADVAAGSVVVRAGERLTPARLGLLASVGRDRVDVRRRPRIGVLATGDEIVRPGRPLGPGRIHSSNPYALVPLLNEAGADAFDLGDAPDTLDGLVTALRNALSCDAVVTTGGVSVGRYDFVKEAFAAIGATMDFWKVRMKPGKPLAFGTVRDGHQTVALFGLPGNPVSCLVNAEMFVVPWIRVAMGSPRPFPGTVPATWLEDVRERPGRAKLLRVRLERTADGLGVRLTGSQSSGVLSSMATAHGLAWVDSETGSIAAGTPVDVQLLDASFADTATPRYPS